MILGKKDKAVIEAFLEGRPAVGLKLSTDGERLDGHWMGGSRIAIVAGRSIVLFDLGSRAAQTVQRVIKKAAPHKWMNAT